MSTRTTAHLLREHHEATRLLSAFRRYLRQVEEHATAHSRDASGFIDFLSESLFQRHEEKEEGVLLPELARMGLSWSDGALARVRQEHRQGRYLVRSLRQALRPGGDWSKEDRAHFLSIAHAWVDFLSDHMRREEQMLFPFIDARMEADIDALVVRQFEKIDQEYGETPDAEMLKKAGEAFVERFGSSTKSG